MDTDVINLAKAIRQSETGGDYNASGSSGEHGGYQFTDDTWNAVAPKYGINVPLKEATPEQQNAVVYNRIKGWKDSGKDVTQIASMWNAGEGEPNAYTGEFSNGKPSTGTNSYGVKYNVPSYVKSVATAYQTIKNGANPGTDTSNPSAVPNQNSGPNSSGYVTNSNIPTTNNSQGQQQDKTAPYNPSFGGLLKDTGTGIAKELTKQAVGTAGLLQTVGQKILSPVDKLLGGSGDTSTKAGYGIKSIDESTPEGAGVKESLAPKNTGEKAAGYGTIAGQFIAPGLGLLKGSSASVASQELPRILDSTIKGGFETYANASPIEKYDLLHDAIDFSSNEAQKLILNDTLSEVGKQILDPTSWGDVHPIASGIANMSSKAAKSLLKLVIGGSVAGGTVLAGQNLISK